MMVIDPSGPDPFALQRSIMLCVIVGGTLLAAVMKWAHAFLSHKRKTSALDIAVILLSSSLQNGFVTLVAGAKIAALTN
jgi:hypothetical protein